MVQNNKIKLTAFLNCGAFLYQKRVPKQTAEFGCVKNDGFRDVDAKLLLEVSHDNKFAI